MNGKNNLSVKFFLLTIVVYIVEGGLYHSNFVLLSTNKGGFPMKRQSKKETADATICQKFTLRNTFKARFLFHFVFFF